MEDNIHGTSEILNACCEAFVERARGWYGFNIHHVEVTKRADSSMSVDAKGGHRTVPVLGIYFREETFSRVVDDRKQIKDSIADDLRDIWNDLTLPYRDDFDRDEYSDGRMYVHAWCYEQKCFYEFISNSVEQISDLLKNAAGFVPYKIYPSHDGINIVYETADYLNAGIDAKENDLRNEIYKLAQAYVAERFRESMEPSFYVKFWHPKMRGYNGYGLWLG